MDNFLACRQRRNIVVHISSKIKFKFRKKSKIFTKFLLFLFLLNKSLGFSYIYSCVLFVFYCYLFSFFYLIIILYFECVPEIWIPFNSYYLFTSFSANAKQKKTANKICKKNVSNKVHLGTKNHKVCQMWT